MAVTWSYENAAHLLRRAAFGGTPSEVQAFFDAHGSVAEAVDTLLAFAPSKKKPPGPRDVDDYNRLKMQRWWLKIMIKSGTPGDACREKLVLFWHNHLASGSRKQPTLKYMALQNSLFRLHARGNFKTLVREYNRDPANLYYLDGIENYASNDGIHVNANENFGRELLELFTLGVSQLATDGLADPTKPNYTEDDVHNMARACTGWVDVKGKIGLWSQDAWDGGRYDDDGDDQPDPMVLWGQPSNGYRIDEGVAGTPNDVLGLVFDRTDDAGNNQVGMFLSKKLWTWYAYPAPAPGMKALLAQFASVFASNDFELTPLLRAMWTHDEFYGDRAKTRSVRNPVDYAVGALRALGIRASNGKAVGGAARELGDQLRFMGMDLFEPPNVAGWPGGLTWINSGTLLARLEFAKDLAAADFGSMRLALDHIEGLPLGQSSADPAVVVDAVVAQLGLDTGPVPLSVAQIAALVAYATDNGARTTLDLSDADTDDARIKVRGLVALALQTAEFMIH
ncbi:MAG: DUF1800 family protein [Candidatus Binatia bacterium]